MTSKQMTLIAVAGSAGLLLGAFGFQLLGYAPCKLCIWQRWPHGAAVALGLIILWRPLIWMNLLGAVAAATSGGLGIYHTGVEQGWWEGPNTCTSSNDLAVSTEELMSQIMSAPLVRCDEIAWELLWLSMASWNALISFGFAAVWLWAWRTGRA